MARDEGSISVEARARALDLRADHAGERHAPAVGLAAADAARGGPSEARPPLSDLGRRIRKLRVERQLTLKQLEDSCGLSATHLSEIERGRTSPTVGALIRIARSLGKVPAFFLEDEERAEAARARRGEGGTLALGTGASAESMSAGIPGSLLYAYRISLDHGAGLELERHETGGETICYVTRGEIESVVGARRARLTIGDAVHSSADLAQRLRATNGRAELIAILTHPLDAAS